MNLGQIPPGFTPPLNPTETFPASREHALPEISVQGAGPWTYAMLLAAAVSAWWLFKE